MGSAFFVSCLGLRRLLGDNLAVHVKMVLGVAQECKERIE
jgi:hypothetical protein